jgi:hypothetical protein
MAEQAAAPETSTNRIVNNVVFDRLEAANDIEGAIAYALYKVSKREWISNHARMSGKAPSEKDLSAFAATQTEAVLTAYRAQARAILEGYARDIVDGERPRIVQSTLRGSFWRSFWPSMAASLAFTVALVVVGVLAALLGFGLPIQINIPPRS